MIKTTTLRGAAVAAMGGVLAWAVPVAVLAQVPSQGPPQGPSQAPARLPTPAPAETGNPQEPLREITLAAGAFVRGAPVPAWAELLPLPDKPAASSGRPIVVRLADSLLVGDPLHLIHSVEGENPIFGQRYVGSASWEQPWPVDIRRVTLSAPEGNPMQRRWVGGLAASTVCPRISTRDGWRQWRFEERDIAPVVLEEHLPANAMPYRGLQFSEYSTWPEFVAWAQRRVPQALQWVQGEVR